MKPVRADNPADHPVRSDPRGAEEAARFLSEASELLATSLDYELTLKRLASLSVPFLGDWCAVDVIQEDRPFRRMAVAHVEPEKAELVRELQERWPPRVDAPAGYPKVLRTGEPDFFPDVPREGLRAAAVDVEHGALLEKLGYRSIICVPITARGRVLGAMTFVIAGESRRFEQQDFELALDLARRAGQAMDNALLFEEVKHGRKSAALLAEVSRVLAATHDVRAALRDVGRLAGGELGDAVLFVIADESGSYELFGWSAPAAEEFIRATRSLANRLPATAPIGVRNALSVTTTESFDETTLAGRLEGHSLSDDERAILDDLRAGITAPMISSGRSVGAFCVRSLQPGRRYSREEVDLATDIAQRSALAIQNSYLHRRATDAILARDEFLSVASHELRTPLTALHLLVRTLQTPEGVPLPLTPAKLEIAERQVLRIAKLVNQLFDLSRVTSGQLQLDLDDVDLSAVVRDVAARMADEASEAACVVAVRTPAPCVGRWDRFRMEQIATNLLANALKYGRGKPVQIAVDDLGDSARLTVSDAGIGIYADHANRIFERFSRANPGRRYEGLGLGLYIIKQILDVLGGKISVESEPGKGSLFVVDVPKAAPRLPST